MDMCRFKHGNDPGYKLFRQGLERYLDEIAPEKKSELGDGTRTDAGTLLVAEHSSANAGSSEMFHDQVPVDNDHSGMVKYPSTRSDPPNSGFSSGQKLSVQVAPGITQKGLDQEGE